MFAVLPLAGCTSTHPGPGPVPTSSRSSAPKFDLVAFDSCKQLLKELRAAARKSYSRPVPDAGIAVDGGNRALAAGAEAAAPAATPFSGTNVNEAGSDEPDIVKTDGRRIVTVANGVLHVIDPASRRETGRLSLGSSGQADLLLSGDRALVLVSGFQRILERRSLVPPSEAGAQAILVDLAGTPQVISRYRGSGRVLDARQTGSVARVVLSSPPRFAESPDAATIDDWLPEWEVTTGGTTTKGRTACGDVSRPPSFSGLSMLSVLTFDLAAPALTDGSPVSLVADGDIVYGTPTSLYIANDQRWRIDTFRDSSAPDSEIFKFTLPPAGKPILAATGAVPGMLLSQYSLSEWDGWLRVATTDFAQRSSAVRVFGQQGGKLVQRGVVDGLGHGEQIYAVRFLGSRGYVVTFRQTDPLYSLDLSDPARPRVTGDLKITGYSAHLQQVGDDRVVGIGQEADAGGVREGLQVSLFDVADPAHPTRLAQHVVPGAGSEAEYDPHALLWWPATHLLVVPTYERAIALKIEGGTLKEAGYLAGGNIRRALVIGDRLWTLSDNELAVADLSTLEPIGRVALS
ncbi:beta-propeller domain-containing protein [Actinoplanes sp. CA-030573]|uniref:beta-propeller domain-containing protein n=1 Tax=Actinoplanes sp. CA-030573 TaxID=3239898 RepID=UPI003D8E1165